MATNKDGKFTKLTEETIKKLEEAYKLIPNNNGGYHRNGMNKEQISKIRWILKQKNIDNYGASARVNSARNYYKRKEYTKKWRKNNEKILKELSKKRNLHIKLTSDGTITKDSVIGMMCGQDYKCKICSKDIRNEYHIDHIIPLNKNGKHTIYNIQLTCPSCNCRKRDNIL